MSPVVQITSDGSHTLLDERTLETYHSVHGALQESNHIFIEHGLKVFREKHVKVLEIGFGTGLNALLALHYAHQHNLKIDYFTLEKFPVALDVVSQLNYTNLLNCESCGQKFEHLHSAVWDNRVEIDTNFSFTKNKVDLCSFNFEKQKFDVVFFDAFSPDRQPELWTDEIFQRIYKQCNIGAILTTYCAKGSVRRALIAAGFNVERLPGPPGKREILRATK